MGHCPIACSPALDRAALTPRSQCRGQSFPQLQMFMSLFLDNKPEIGSSKMKGGPIGILRFALFPLTGIEPSSSQAQRVYASVMLYSQSVCDAHQAAEFIWSVSLYTPTQGELFAFQTAAAGN